MGRSSNTILSHLIVLFSSKELPRTLFFRFSPLRSLGCFKVGEVHITVKFWVIETEFWFPVVKLKTSFFKSFPKSGLDRGFSFFNFTTRTLPLLVHDFMWISSLRKPYSFFIINNVHYISRSIFPFIFSRRYVRKVNRNFLSVQFFNFIFRI